MTKQLKGTISLLFCGLCGPVNRTEMARRKGGFTPYRLSDFIFTSLFFSEIMQICATAANRIGRLMRA
jgi:hypothetical protein